MLCQISSGCFRSFGRLEFQLLEGTYSLRREQSRWDEFKKYCYVWKKLASFLELVECEKPVENNSRKNFRFLKTKVRLSVEKEDRVLGRKENNMNDFEWWIPCVLIKITLNRASFCWNSNFWNIKISSQWISLVISENSPKI